MSASWHVVKLDGNTNNAANTGAFYMNANNTSTNDNVNIGSQLALNIELDIKTMPLGKIHNKISQVLVGLTESRTLRDN